MSIIFGAAQFKTRCLELIDQVAQTGQEIRVSKRGQPMVRILPDIVAEPRSAYGFLAGSARYQENLQDSGAAWASDHD